MYVKCCLDILAFTGQKIVLAVTSLKVHESFLNVPSVKVTNYIQQRRKHEVSWAINSNSYSWGGGENDSKDRRKYV